MRATHGTHKIYRGKHQEAGRYSRHCVGQLTITFCARDVAAGRDQNKQESSPNFRKNTSPFSGGIKKFTLM